MQLWKGLVKMSKLYNKYLNLKHNDSEKMYLFKSGIFYLFLDEDAKKISSVLSLKLTNLNENVVKCGFPVSKLEKYISLLNNLNFNIEIINSLDEPPSSPNKYLCNSSLKTLIIKLSEINPDSLSIKEIYSLMDDLTSKAKEIRKELE